MAYDKLCDSAALDAGLTTIANAIREKSGTTESLSFPDGMAAAVEAIETGGSTPVPWNDVTFIDYDGTVLYSYTLEEAKALTELPELPTRQGLICQTWNTTLAKIQNTDRPMTIGAIYITDDGKTRIYITLREGRTSPMLGCCPNGTVTVDWGDGTTPDVVTGTSTTAVVWTPTHQYASAGDYVIKLTVDGEMSFTGNAYTTNGSYLLRHAESNVTQNNPYKNCVRKIELGSGITFIGAYSFYNLTSLANIVIPQTVRKLNAQAFSSCASLTAVVIPAACTCGEQLFQNCYSLSRVALPDRIAGLAARVFFYNYALHNVEIVTSVTSIGDYAFYQCKALANVVLPKNLRTIGANAFSGCLALSSVTFSSQVSTIGSGAFSGCNGMRFYDFTARTSVTTLADTTVFNGIPSDCEIRVPAALYDQWIADANWSTYASQIVAV